MTPNYRVVSYFAKHSEVILNVSLDWFLVFENPGYCTVFVLTGIGVCCKHTHTKCVCPVRAVVCHNTISRNDHFVEGGCRGVEGVLVLGVSGVVVLRVLWC